VLSKWYIVKLFIFILKCQLDGTKDAANSEIITKYKGVELILTAMKRFPYHISLQTTGNL